MTEEEVYKMARLYAAYGLFCCNTLKFMEIVPKRAAYYESCIAYLNQVIKERWPDHEADLQDGQNK